MAEIIDLTVSPRPDIIEVSSDHEYTPAHFNQTQKKQQKRSKGKTSNGLAGDGIDSSFWPSKAQSLENGDKLDESASRTPCISSSTIEEPDIFIFDSTAAPIAVENSIPEPVQSDETSSKLLLPSHVFIFHEDSSIPSEALPPPQLSSGDEDYIEYLDYGDRKAPGLVRYFEVEGVESNKRPPISKCKNCGAEGDHKTYECPIQICLTCGARDEHSTRSCPISKTCYTCGMKGHINKTCPNRFSVCMAPSDFHGDCNRCGSTKHKVNECPTLWRIYQYVNDEERIVIMRRREEKKQLAIGEGGEGYTGGDLWCYNCANDGHLGDDCDELPHSPLFPAGYSAFSSHNIMSGPFYDPAADLVATKRRSRERGNEANRNAGFPVDVGKRGKNKERERFEKRFREQEDEGEDWFNGIRNVRKRGPPSSHEKKFKFGLFKDGSYENPSEPSLLARLSDAHHKGKARGRDDHNHEGPSHRLENSIRIRGAATDQKNQDAKYMNSRKTEQYRGSKQGHGPRYKGGYDR